MKRYLKYLLGTTLLFTMIFAQVTEGTVKFNLGEHNALQLFLTNVDKKLVEDEWKFYTDRFGKPDKKKGEFISSDVSLAGLSNQVDWYMKLEKSKKDIILQLCVISNEEFLTSANQNDNFLIIEKYLDNFVLVVEKAKIKANLESENKTLSKMQKELKKLNKHYDGNLKSIGDHTKKINKAEKDNKSNLKKQAKARDEISTQGLIVEETLSNSSGSISTGEVSEEYEEANKKLLKMQKKLDKLVDDYESNVKTIGKSSKKIEKAQKDNRNIAKKQKKLKKDISDQGDTVETIRAQLESLQ